MKLPRTLSCAVVLCGFILTVGSVAAVPPPAPDSATMAKAKARVSTVEQLHELGWKTDKPAYPAAARETHEMGDVYLAMTTDDAGKITRATTAKVTKTPILDASSAAWVKAHWHGPANAEAIVCLSYRLR